jgi:GWxTD domain-containing protein
MRRFAFAALVTALAAISGVAGAQDAARRLLGPDWFDDDEWHLDVRYIITPEELATYRALTTVQARDEFIVGFWRRRDPTPGTAPNEFRDEFTRRVEYANAHFEDPNDAPHPGVESDRGRIYVTFGPPEKIETYRTGAYEFWRYPDRDAGFVFEFSLPPINTCDGSYRILSPAPLASARGAFTTIDVYPRQFVTVTLAVDFSRTASVTHTLRRADGREVPSDEAMQLTGQVGPAGTDPLSRHFLACRLFGTDGMGFTQPLPPGSYNLSSRIVLLGGALREEQVPFDVR